MFNEQRQPERTLRASDTEREQTISALRAHHAAGRLQTNELDQRIATALRATTVTKLDDQLRDLPNPSAPTKAAAVGRHGAWR